MKIYFVLLLSILCLSNTTLIGATLVGAFETLTDPKSEQYTGVVQFIVTTIPKLTSWNVQSLKRQLVNGYNYVAEFTSSSHYAQVRVYSTFAKVMNITAYSLDSQSQTIPSSPLNLITVIALTNITNQTESNSTINNETNSTLSNNSVSDVYLVQNPLVLDKNFVGGYQSLSLNNTSQFQGAWSQIASKYPQLKNYEIIEVRRQVVAGLNYVFVVESLSKNQIIVIKVYQSLTKNYTVNILQTNTAVGYSSEQIITIQNKCLQLNPALVDYQLVYISNVEGTTGLRLIYSLKDSFITADCTFDGDSIIVTFQ